MTSIQCPRCGAAITSRGVSHSGPGSQWECRCGHVEQDQSDYWTERTAGDDVQLPRCVRRSNSPVPGGSHDER